MAVPSAETRTSRTRTGGGPRARSTPVSARRSTLTRILINLPPKLLEQVDQYAEEREWTRAETVRDALRKQVQGRRNGRGRNKIKASGRKKQI